MPGARVIVDVPGCVPYDVRVGASLLATFGESLRCADRRSQHAVVISDDETGALFRSPLMTSLEKAGFKTVDITVPRGAQAASVDCARELWQAFDSIALPRATAVVALGGRDTCALASFVAANYRAGTTLALVPTTFDAAIDSSVALFSHLGLKEAGDIVACRAQPAYVCVSLDILKSATEEEWAVGCAHAARAALYGSDDFLFWLSDAAPSLRVRDETVCAMAIARAVAARADLLGSSLSLPQDAPSSMSTLEEPPAFGYGNVFARAALTLAEGKCAPAQMLAEGMRFAMRLGAALIGTPLELVREQDALLDALALPVTGRVADLDAMVNAMAAYRGDGEGVVFSLPRDVGDFVSATVPFAVLREHLEARNRGVVDTR